MVEELVTKQALFSVHSETELPSMHYLCSETSHNFFTASKRAFLNKRRGSVQHGSNPLTFKLAIFGPIVLFIREVSSLYV